MGDKLNWRIIAVVAIIVVVFLGYLVVDLSRSEVRLSRSAMQEVIDTTNCPEIEIYMSPRSFGKQASYSYSDSTNCDSPETPLAMPTRECKDGVDNDGDGLVDYPTDLGCSNKNDNDESNCGDGVCEGGETTDGCTEDCAMGCGNGVCEEGEDCEVCPFDCTIGTYCGDGVCQPLAGEDCLSCAFDCNGKQNGNPNNRFCCGDGEGQNPVSCGDPRCTESGFQCDGDAGGETQCCGDGVCLPPESNGTCMQDCG